jgi:mannan endo-1,4-beta-mannosidase
MGASAHDVEEADLAGLRLTLLGVAVLAVLASFVGAAAQEAGATVSGVYSAVDLGSLGGDYSEAFRISDTGQVVGISMTADDAASHAFSWTELGGMVDLGTLGGAWSTSAGVNDQGTVVGTSNLTGISLGQDLPRHAFAWTDGGGMRDLGTLGGSWSQANAINDSDEVVGISEGAAGAPSQRAFLWTPAGGMVDLGTLGGSYAAAWAINDKGQVAGNSTLAGNNANHTFIWSAATAMQDIGTLGGSYSQPTAINAAGQVVGVSAVTGDMTRHAFSWTKAGGIVDLGTLGGANSQATAVSNGGQVVGVSDVPGGGEHAFSWTPAGGMQDLGDLAGAGSNALGVDDNGRSFGGSNGSDGQEHPVFWAAPGATTDLPTLGGLYGQPNAVNACGDVAGGSDLAGDQAEHATLWLPNTTFVGRCGAKLTLETQPYRPIGINIYNANSRSNCWYDMVNGTTLDDSLIAIGSGKNAIRAWFFQDLATSNGQRDWTAFDHTLAVARAHGVKVIATLGNQWADCEPLAGYKNTAWYSGGYRQPDPGGTVSYRDWVQEAAARYKDDPTILAWQLINEPEVLPYKDADCSTVPESTAYGLLSAFAADVSAAIKRVDPNHLVSLGTIGSGQCGAQADDFTKLMEIPTLDLCEFHDYTPDHLVPGDQWNGLQRRIDQCNALGKPLLVGELGIRPIDVGGRLQDRADVVDGKLCAQFRAGVAGMLMWAWDKNGSLLDNYDIGPLDPVLGVLAPWSDPFHTCAAVAPSAPRSVVAAAGDGSASVSWLPPASDGAAAITGYTVTASPGPVTATVAGSATTATVMGLSNGTAYTFTVRATNVAGTGALSAASTAVTPQLGYPTPAAASGAASPTNATTVSTGTDPAATGGTATSVTVPAGTAGGVVSVTQSGTSEPAPSGYQFGGVQIDISAPSASAASPLTLVFSMTASAGQTPDSTQIYRAEGAGTPMLVPDCGGPSGQAVPDPCVSSRRSVTINGSTDIQLTVLSSSASHWNSATPKPGGVSVSDGGYSPQNLTIQPGAYVNWSFAGKKSHSVTDSAGLGPSGAAWFDSGAKSSGSYRFTFLYAGTFPYKSTVKGDSMIGTVFVPVIVTPATGRSTTSFSVIWSTRSLATSGFVADLQYRFRPAGTTGWKSWTTWKSGATTTSAPFTANQGAGTYAFHARLRSTSTGRASSYSPDGTIAVS